MKSYAGVGFGIVALGHVVGWLTLAVVWWLATSNGGIGSWQREAFATVATSGAGVAALLELVGMGLSIAGVIDKGRTTRDVAMVVAAVALTSIGLVGAAALAFGATLLSGVGHN